MRKNLAIIGASYLQLPLIEKAKQMGYTTHVFAWAAGDVGEKAADFFYPISITEVDDITNKCRDIGICGICSIATDLGSYTVNHVANALGLPGNGIESACMSTNKHLMREAFSKRGDPSPRSILVDETTDYSNIELTYPIVVKPTDRSGSRGVSKLESSDTLEEAVRAAIDASFEKKALVEDYVEGQEYSVEGISFNGIHHILAMTVKHTTGAPHFIETGHLEPAPMSEFMYQKVVMVVKHALDTLKIQNGASHSELKIDSDGTIKIIEIGARMGGDCIGSELVYYSTGIDYVRAVIQVACGHEPDLTVEHAPIPAEVKYLFTWDDVTEMNRVKLTDEFIKVVAFFPENIGKTTDSSNRAGCYIMKAQ